MLNWNAFGTHEGGQFALLDTDDWGKDVVNGVGIDSISHFELINEDQKVMLFVRKGVIHIGEDNSLKLGINLGGYMYTLYDSCVFSLEDIAPFTTAVYTSSTNKSEDLGKHLMLKYKVTAIMDKLEKKKIKLDTPIEKTFLLHLDKYGYLSIC